MKKIYFLALTFVSLYSNAQLYTVDFENSLSTAETYDNGSGGAGDFTFDDLVLSNSYNQAWSSWAGFSLSNITDNTTAGWGNQYASSTGDGNNSSTYAVFYADGFTETYLNAENMKSIDSFYINTTAYSRLSMLNGDAVGKQFGSPLNAQGMDDETNGEDFFRVWIISSDETGANKDSMEFYLADYRFADDNDDYIINDWTKVDLSSLSTYPKQILTFRFESSDIGDFGINTPTYFAIDDISYHQVMGVDEVELDVDIYPNPVSDIVNVKGENGQVTISDINGNVVLTTSHNLFSSIDVSSFASGVYFLQLENNRGKMIQKIIK